MPSLSHLGPILLIDDDPIVAVVLRGLFKAAGVQNLVVGFLDTASAERYLLDAIARAAREPERVPVLICVDLNMPTKGGFEMIRWIHQHPALGSVKIVMLSASNTESNREQALALGAHQYFVKYPSQAELKALLEVSPSAS